MAHLLERPQTVLHLLGRRGIARTDAGFERHEPLQLLADELRLFDLGTRVQRAVERLERVLRSLETETGCDRRERQP